ncbi:hypothetical protein [Fibrobacter sp. UBA4309]|uniref:hypothetical protein n=1 Tax=Fibrobacter sp. UBA4309 TaxID=1946537 RepID=UPI0025C0201B|nr:hypothetical protein [Fibrobacter sp. UBA4309]
MEIATLCISLLSFFAALAAVIVPIVIFKKQRKYDEEAEQRSIERERQAEQRRKKEIRQDAQDRLKAKRVANESPLARLAGVTEELEETTYLEMRSKRR